jgi:putative sterol carrier protein
MVSADEGRAAPFVVAAPYSRWKDVLAGELDPIKGMMQGKLKLEGDLPTIIRYVRAANELVLLTQTVPTDYLDEHAAGAR